MSTVPVINLQDYLSGNPERKAAFVASLGKAYEDIGFVAVEGHGIPDELIERFYTLVESFFALPVETKLNYEIPELAGQRGYTSLLQKKQQPGSRWSSSRE